MVRVLRDINGSVGVFGTPIAPWRTSLSLSIVDKMVYDGEHPRDRPEERGLGDLLGAFERIALPEANGRPDVRGAERRSGRSDAYPCRHVGPTIRLTILPFSGERTTERSEGGYR